MDRPTIGNQEAMFQAGSTVDVYLGAAVKMLDGQFGEGYAKANPQLVAALVSSQANDYNSVSLVKALYAIADAVEGQP